MCGAMLRWIRTEINLEPRYMRAILVPPGQPAMPRRTYEDYEAGKRGIPAKLAARIRELYQQNLDWIAAMDSRIDAAEKRGKK